MLASCSSGAHGSAGSLAKQMLDTITQPSTSTRCKRDGDCTAFVLPGTFLFLVAAVLCCGSAVGRILLLGPLLLRQDTREMRLLPGTQGNNTVRRQTKIAHS